MIIHQVGGFIVKRDEIIEQIELIEMDHKIKPNSKRREEITRLMNLIQSKHLEIHSKQSQIHTPKDLDELRDIQQSLYENILLLIDVMEHPKFILDTLEKERFFQIKEHPLLILDSVTGLLFPESSDKYKYKYFTLAERNRVLKKFELSGLQEWEFPEERDLKRLFDRQISQYHGITSTANSTIISGYRKVWINGNDVDSIFDMHRLNYLNSLVSSIAQSMFKVNSSISKNTTPNEYLTHSENALFIPINKSLKPEKYEITLNAKASKRLAIFLYNPQLNFKNLQESTQHKFEQLYRLFYVDYLNLHAQLSSNEQVPVTVNTISTSNVSISTFSIEAYQSKTITSLNSHCQTSLSFLATAETYLVESDKSLNELHQKINDAVEVLLQQPKSKFLQDSLQLIVDTLSFEKNHPLTFIRDAKQNISSLEHKLKEVSTYADLLEAERTEKVSYAQLIDFSEMIIQNYINKNTFLT